MKKLRWIMVGLFVILYMQNTMAQDSSSAGQEAVMLSSMDVKVSAQNSNQVLLSDFLSTLEKLFDVTFLYKNDVMKNKYIHKDDIPIGEQTGRELSRILDRLGITFQKIDEQTYVLLAKTKSMQAETAQEEISGTVTDAQSGETLPGVNILVKGTTTGASTGPNGQYELTVPSLQDTLVVSYIGYQTQEVPIEGRTTVDVALQSQAISGEEVVVTALGIDRQSRSLGYSISQVEPEEMTVNRTPNFMDALQGKMAGVNVSQMGTGPQGSSKVRIRGQSSFGGNNSPLIVVNGVPIDNTSRGVGGDVSERGANRSSDSGDGLSSINPDNIQEMTVLKGGAAAALYGSRAKDGVIMITTKHRAEGDGIQLEYNTNFTYDIPMDFRDYQMQYGQGEHGERPTEPFPVSGQWSFGEKFEPGMTQILFDGLEVPYEPQPNQLKEYYQNGTSLNNTISLSSGGENGGFNLSFSNLRSQAVLPGSDYARNNISLGFTQDVANRITLKGNVTYSNEDRTNPPNIIQQDYSPVSIYNLANSMPMDVLEKYCCDEEGNETPWSRFTNRTNPYFTLKRFENNVRDRVFGSLTARIDLTEWLYVQGRFGQDYYSREQEYNRPTGSQRESPAPPGFVNGEYVQDQTFSREINADVLVGADKTFGNFGLNMLGGGNLMHRKRNRYNVLAEDFFQRGIYSIENARVSSPQHNISERQVNSLYGSAEFSYREMLYVTGTLRNDWFSTLSPAERSVLYPSVTTTFVFSDAFSLPGWLTYGKVRASYAEVGSDTDVPPYANRLFYEINSNFFNGQPVGSISGNTVPNPDLRPMRVSEWEVGIDMTLFENLSFELAYYDKTSSDQILNQQISNTSGFTSRRVNVGESKNQGVEMLLDFSPIETQNMFWNVNFNAAYNTTEVVDLGEDIGVDEITVGTAEFHGELRQVTGMPMNQLYGWGWLRDDQGRVVHNDSGIPIRSEEQLNFGSSIPLWTGGITNSFNYRGISMSFLIDFKLGHNLISGTHTNAYRHGLDKATLVGREQGYVVGEGVSEDGSENTAHAPVQAYYESIRSHRISEESVFNAGSWQLRQITVGYNFTNVADQLGLRGLRLSAVANNVAVLKSWVPHIHPDQSGAISDTQQGLEATGLPVTRSIGFNLNVQI